MRDSSSEVLRTIATEGPISRADLTRILGLSGPTLTQATKFLIQRGLVHELNQVPSTGGRPATLLGLVADAGQIIGLKLSPKLITGVCVNLESKILWEFVEPFNAKGEAAVEALEEVLNRQIPKVDGSLLGIGIGIPGVVSPKDGVRAKSVMLGWDDTAVGEQLSERLGVPVLLQNDVNTLAVAESLFGQGRSSTNFLTLTVGLGVGMGIVVDGELFNGSHGAGEFGHVTVANNDRACECGKTGCLETMAADGALLAKAAELGFIPKNATLDVLLQKARTDSQVAKSIFQLPFETLGLSLANVVNVLGSDLVIVSGEGSQSWDIWGSWFQQAFEMNLVPTMQDVQVVVDPWDDKKWALGATAVVLQASLGKRSSSTSESRQVRNRLKQASLGVAF